MKTCLFSMAVVFSALSLSAQDLATIGVASDEWANCTQKDGTGLYFETMRLAFPDSKLDIKIVPSARSIEMVESAKTDVCVGVYQGDVKNGIYPKYPIDFDDMSVLMLASKAASWAGEPGLKNKKVAWIVDYGYEKYLNVPVKLTEVSDTASGVKMLQAGRVDFYVETKSTIVPYLADNKISEKDFHLETVKWIKLYLAFAQNAKGKALQTQWDKAIPVLYKSGQLQKVFAKWGFQESFDKLKKEF